MQYSAAASLPQVGNVLRLAGYAALTDATLLTANTDVAKNVATNENFNVRFTGISFYFNVKTISRKDTREDEYPTAP